MVGLRGSPHSDRHALVCADVQHHLRRLRRPGNLPADLLPRPIWLEPGGGRQLRGAMRLRGQLRAARGRPSGRSPWRHPRADGDLCADRAPGDQRRPDAAARPRNRPALDDDGRARERQRRGLSARAPALPAPGWGDHRHRRSGRRSGRIRSAHRTGHAQGSDRYLWWWIPRLRRGRHSLPAVDAGSAAGLAADVGRTGRMASPSRRCRPRADGANATQRRRLVVEEFRMMQSDIVPVSGQAICPYCGVGCLVDVTVNHGKVTGVRGAPGSPVNRGLLCPKGALLDRILDLPGRLTTPLIRAHRDEPFQAVDWPTALAEVARRITSILTAHGPDALALYGSGQLDTEAWYLGNKLFKGYLGSNHVDSNSRLCMASAVAGYRLSLGSDGPPTCYDDISHADLYLIVGANMADAHPIAWGRIKAHRRLDPSAAGIVVDPRHTHTAQAADVHVPLRPGSDIAFFNALGRIILDRNAADQGFIARHTAGCEAYAELLRSVDLEEMAEICGVPLSLIEQVAGRLINAGGLLSFYSMGLNQSTVGVWKNNALINLHLLLGQIGKPGAGPFSLTGQPNAMGGRELGGLAQLLPGYRQIENPAHRAEVEAAWGCAPGAINPKPGLTAVEQFQALAEGRLKATWIVCNNAAVSLPNLAAARCGLERAELVILQDAFETETTAFADIILPAAQWIEKEGTTTNSERRVTRSQQLVEPRGLSQPDWWIFDQVASTLGFPGFGYSGVDAIWDEYRKLTAGEL